jgi:hypothetical protein
MNKYVLITSMKPVFDCFNAPCRAKLRQTCKWCNQYIRRHLDSAGAQLVIRRAWYYYKLYKNLCVSAAFTPYENLKQVLPKSKVHLLVNNARFYGTTRAIILLTIINDDYTSTIFENLVKRGIELFILLDRQWIGMQLDVVKYYYIRLYGNHKNLSLDLEINNINWIHTEIPENVIAVRINFGSLPTCMLMNSSIDVTINYPVDLQHRYLYGKMLHSRQINCLRSMDDPLTINHKIFIEAFHSDDSRKIIGNVINEYTINESRCIL